MFKFPDVEPNVPTDFHGWFDGHNKEFLKKFINNDTKIILELGAWLGKSTIWFCENSNAKIISIDHWKGSKEHNIENRKETFNRLPTLYDTFIKNCWKYRERITPIKTDTLTGMYWCKDNDITPNLIFVDASHEYEDVISDLKVSTTLFKDAIICGDDWSWQNKLNNYKKTVQEAVLTFIKENNYKLIENGRCWQIYKQ